MTTNLKTKSDHNLIASDLLLQNALPAASIHCSYYACVQLMLHMLYSHFSMNETDIEVDMRHSSKKTMHVWLIKIFFDKISSKPDKRTFNSKINQLKGLRVKADYENVSISDEDASKSFQYSKEIIVILKNHFSV